MFPTTPSSSYTRPAPKLNKGKAPVASRSPIAWHIDRMERNVARSFELRMNARSRIDELKSEVDLTEPVGASGQSHELRRLRERARSADLDCQEAADAYDEAHSQADEAMATYLVRAERRRGTSGYTDEAQMDVLLSALRRTSELAQEESSAMDRLTRALERLKRREPAPQRAEPREGTHVPARGSRGGAPGWAWGVLITLCVALIILAWYAIWRMETLFAQADDRLNRIDNKMYTLSRQFHSLSALHPKVETLTRQLGALTETVQGWGKALESARPVESDVPRWFWPMTLFFKLINNGRF
ncbi:hypothetical protein DM02DRAFT_627906 [Periconia macrospinosa]|uniref:Uncharacterized protein n=1 Tax=Periconia macrospinosa TaxID=97972 RepID=A0A2V1DSJ0_9PLEO|nr:hypothetical protein DM02DRAFT_627906 [Periconia macrospinosa]